MTSRRRFARWTLVLMVLPAAMLFVGTGTANAGGSCHSAATTGKGTAVSLHGLCFGPTVLYVQPETRVTWTNRDRTDHTVTGLGFTWGSGDSLFYGDSISYRFAKAGVYPYSCIIHPGMVGAVVVGDAGSPKAVAGVPLAVAAAAPSPSAAVQAVPRAATDTQAVVSTSAGPWRTIAFVTLALLAAAMATLAIQRRQRGIAVKARQAGTA
jgi:plastocyanin